MTLSSIDYSPLITSLEWFFIGYFFILHGGHTLLAAASVNNMRLRMESVAIKMLPRLSAGYEIPVSILVPVSEATPELAQFIRTLFEFRYPQFEIIVINDTGEDAISAELRSAFDLVIFPEAYWRQVPSRTVHHVYRSPQLPGLRVIEKNPGGPGDALNAGVNAARYPLMCIVRPGCVLNRDSLRRLVPDFLDDASTVAAGAVQRVVNGSFIVNGFLERCRLAGNPLVWMQAAARLRRDLCARYGWAGTNTVLAIADGFCAFRKEAVVQAGGFARDAINPVVELVGRLHRLSATADKRYRIALLPAPVLWQLAPTTPGAVCSSAANEQYGLVRALKPGRSLPARLNSGIAGHLASPFVVLTEIAGPLIESLAWLFFLTGFGFGIIPAQHLIAFAVCAAGFGILVSWLAILIDALAFRSYEHVRSYVLLLLWAIFENAGFRQVIAVCKLLGFRFHPAPKTARNH